MSRFRDLVDIPVVELGCFADQLELRALNASRLESAAMTTQLCAQHCHDEEYDHFGLQYGIEVRVHRDGTYCVLGESRRSLGV